MYILYFWLYHIYIYINYYIQNYKKKKKKKIFILKKKKKKKKKSSNFTRWLYVNSLSFGNIKEIKLCIT